MQHHGKLHPSFVAPRESLSRARCFNSRVPPHRDIPRCPRDYSGRHFAGRITNSMLHTLTMPVCLCFIPIIALRWLTALCRHACMGFLCFLTVRYTNGNVNNTTCCHKFKFEREKERKTIITVSLPATELAKMF